MQLITRPNFTSADLAEFGNLPPGVRNEVDRWLQLLATVTKPIQDSLEAVARQMDCSYKTARRKYDDLRKTGDWRVLINRAKVPEAVSALSPEFLKYINALADKNQRKTRPAWRAFCRDWRAGKSIPGLDNSLPRHCLPEGTGYDNVVKKIRDEFSRTAMRKGLGAAVAKCGPKIFTTRANLWPMSHMPIDDLWHDNFVVFSGRSGARAQIVRVLELDALDVFTGKLLAFGAKPRIKRGDGTMDGLKLKYATLLVADVFFNVGYSPRGTILMAEHGTGAVPERVARILYDRTGGLIQLRESGMTGEEQVICGHYGEAKGNPRFKGALESIRNLKHNELGPVPGQTGMNRDDRPEQTHGMLKDCEDMLKAMAVLAQKNPARARQLRLNLLDYHADFLPLLIDVYREINNRDWHELEGWAKIPGNLQIQYRTTPTSDHWLTDGEFSALPVLSRTCLLEAAKEDRRYLQSRRLSPAQAWNHHCPSGSLLNLPPFVVGEILGDDFSFDLESRGSYFNAFEDMELDTEPLLYENVITTPDGHRQQLRDDKYWVTVNPFNLSQLFVHDASKVCLGIAQRAERVDRSNPEQLTRAYGNRSRRLAELKAPIVARHADMIREETKRLEHNARVLDLKKPFTPEEIAEANFVKERGPEAAAAILESVDPASEDTRSTDAGDNLLRTLSGRDQ
jgi:hypothetical protein